MILLRPDITGKPSVTEDIKVSEISIRFLAADLNDLAEKMRSMHKLTSEGKGSSACTSSVNNMTFGSGMIENPHGNHSICYLLATGGQAIVMSENEYLEVTRLVEEMNAMVEELNDRH